MAAWSTFFRIYPPEGVDGKEWARQQWDTHGFDYDRDQTTYNVVIAWSLESDDELKNSLEAAQIEYTTFKADPDSFFS
jgi:hypothetical protein